MSSLVADYVILSIVLFVIVAFCLFMVARHWYLTTRSGGRMRAYFARPKNNVPPNP